MIKFFFHRDTLLASIFVGAVTLLLGLIVINLHIFDPLEKAFRDFDLSDIYFSEKLTVGKGMDTNIVVVNIGTLDRDSLGLLINKVKERQARVIAVDAFFTERREPSRDSVLRSSLAYTPNIVLAGWCNYKSEDVRFEGPDPYFKGGTVGFVNLKGAGDYTTTVRSFSPFIHCKNKVYNSLAAAVVARYDPSAYARLKFRANEEEVINYSGGGLDFLCLDAKEVFDTLRGNLLKGKIVLLGYTGPQDERLTDVTDMHFTPMNSEIAGKSLPDMRGVIIHANIISMILRDGFIDPAPLWLEWLVGFILLYLLMGFFIYLYTKKARWYHFIGKLVILIVSVLLVWVSLLLFAKAGIQFSIAPALLLIVLSTDILYFYDGIMIFLQRKRGIKTLFGHH